MGVSSSTCATCRPGASKEATAKLFRAVRTADFGLARESLSNGADANAMDEVRAMFIACRFGLKSS